MAVWGSFHFRNHHVSHGVVTLLSQTPHHSHPTRNTFSNTDQAAFAIHMTSPTPVRFSQPSHTRKSRAMSERGSRHNHSVNITHITPPRRPQGIKLSFAGKLVGTSRMAWMISQFICQSRHCMRVGSWSNKTTTPPITSTTTTTTVSQISPPSLFRREPESRPPPARYPASTAHTTSIKSAQHPHRKALSCLHLVPLRAQKRHHVTRQTIYSSLHARFQ